MMDRHELGFLTILGVVSFQVLVLVPLITAPSLVAKQQYMTAFQQNPVCRIHNLRFNVRIGITQQHNAGP